MRISIIDTVRCTFCQLKALDNNIASLIENRLVKTFKDPVESIKSK